MVFWQTPSPIPPGSVVLDGKRIEIQSPSRKLDDKRHGPFEIIEQIGDASYRLLPPCWKIHDVFHVLKLVPFKPPVSHYPSTSATRRRQCLAKILSHKSLCNKLFISSFSLAIASKMHVGFLYSICPSNLILSESFLLICPLLFDFIFYIYIYFFYIHLYSSYIFFFGGVVSKSPSLLDCSLSLFDSFVML